MLGGLALIDHPGNEFDDPTLRARGIVPTPRDQSRRPKLLDQNCRSRLFIEQQHGDGIAALEYQPPLVAAHAAVVALMPDDQLIDFEEIIEQALLPTNFDTPTGAHAYSFMSSNRVATGASPSQLGGTR